uniref:L1 transposable element RRM domain-containing protein n=1 Tax=Latimeria chalumnae TaxID=7897 RepID=H3AJH9_LATCH
EPWDNRRKSNRNNLRVVGFPESVEQGKPIKFLLETLPGLLKLPEDVVLDIEKVHRSLAPKPAAGQRPRPFIIKFLRFQVKERLLVAARDLGMIEWQGNRIQLFPDLSRDLQQKLRELGLKYGFFYPAVLRLTVDGETKSFSTPQKVEVFLKKREGTGETLK